MCPPLSSPGVSSPGPIHHPGWVMPSASLPPPHCGGFNLPTPHFPSPSHRLNCKELLSTLPGCIPGHMHVCRCSYAYYPLCPTPRSPKQPLAGWNAVSSLIYNTICSLIYPHSLISWYRETILQKARGTGPKSNINFQKRNVWKQKKSVSKSSTYPLQGGSH